MALIDPTQYTIVEATTPAPTSHPTAEATLAAEFVLVGGGARANWKETGGAGSVLVASRPGSGQSWYAAAKDHDLPNPTTVTAFAIGVRKKFLDSLGMTVVRFRGTSAPEDARPRVSCGPGPNAVLVSGGAETHWGGAGSLLTASVPLGPQNGGPPDGYVWFAEGKDHMVSDPARITSWALALVKYG